MEAALRKKGWNDAEIRRALNVVQREEHHDIFLSRMVFWSAMMVIIFANIVISFVLLFFLIAFNQWLLYATIILLAGLIGFLYNFLITDIGHLKRHHHLLAGIIIPVLALANMLAVVWLSNRFINNLQVQNQPHNIWLVAVVFAIAFIIPYLADRMILYTKEKKM
ncbi:hypothetical protein HYX14_05385 [Candidatus Woesearchaeota archaeon]|nr:hypothetical protein [Candidatus Woesearchaeota archaeon]